MADAPSHRHRPHPTGVAVLDSAVGGVAPGLGLVIAGDAGTGRTVLCLQLAAAAVARGERAVYLTSERPDILLRQSSALGLDLAPGLSTGRLALLELVPAASMLVRSCGVAPLLAGVADESPGADWIILDPLTALTADLLDERPLRDAIGTLLCGYADGQRIVASVDADAMRRQAQTERALSDLCGALVHLGRDEDGGRTLSVLKSRFATEASRLEFTIGRLGTHLRATAPLVSAAEVTASPAARAPAPGLAPATGPGASSAGIGAASGTSGAAGAVPPGAPSGAPPAAAVAASPERLGSAAAPAASRATAIDSAIQPPAEPAAQDAKAGPVHILVVQSDVRRAGSLASVLRAEFSVELVHTGFEAVSACVALRPDVIVLDTKLPDVSGYEVLSALQRAPEPPPVLAMSGTMARAADRIRALVLGAADVLPSHASHYELRRKVHDVLRAPRRPRDPSAASVDAEDLLVLTGSSARKLSPREFRTRVERAVRFGEAFGIDSTLVVLEAGAKDDLDPVVAAAERLLRAEDAILPWSDRAALLLLVAADELQAPVVVQRVKACTDGDVKLAWGCATVSTSLLAGAGVRLSHDGALEAGDVEWERLIESIPLEVW